MSDSVTVSRRRAADLATAAIKQIDEMRRQRWAELIQVRKAQRGRWRFWMPWLKTLTSEEIRRRETQEYPNPNCFASDIYRKAEAVLRMSEGADETESVTLSAETFCDLWLTFRIQGV